MKVVLTLGVSLLSVFFVSISSQNKPLQESIKKGGETYQNFCIACHQANGQGLAGAFPPLAKSDYLMNNRAKSIHAVKYGLQGEITVNGTKYNSVMADLGLTDEEIANVLNYVTNSWGNKNEKMITVKEVTDSKK
jgi:mono/diheme cytochrome c family protein